MTQPLTATAVARLHCRAIARSGIAAALGLCLLPAALAAADRTVASGRDGTAIVPNPIAAVALSQLTATRARPLFAPSRRPPDPAPSPPAAVVAVAMPPPAAPPTPPPFTLVGTITSAAVNIAIVKHATTGRVIALKSGDLHEGWTVSTIGRRAVRLNRDERSEEVALQKVRTDLVRSAAETSHVVELVPAPIMLVPDTAMAQPSTHSFGPPPRIAPAGPPG